MKDYKRYMDRQQMPAAGMEKLLKLETERPKKTYRAPVWLKYAGVAACLCLIAGLVALPFLRRGQRQAGPGLQELYFNQVAAAPLTDQALAGGMELNELDAARAAEYFGSSPDDFPAFLEDLGLGQFDMEYYTVDMGGPLRLLVRGDYVSPRPEPDTASSLYAMNTVWLEIFEGHSYGAEDDWKELTPCTVNGRRVVAARDETSGYRASAVFDLEWEGKTYGVLYSASCYGEERGAASAKELVTRLVNRLTETGIVVPQGGLVFNPVEAAPQNSCVPEGLDDQWIRDTELLELLKSDGETLGWTDFYVSGNAAPVGQDPESGWGTHYFRGTGSRGDGSEFELDLMPDLTDFPAYVARDVADWDALEKSVVNGHLVTAATFFDRQSRMCYAAATFVVKDSLCDYGVFYCVRVKTEAEAKELVTRLVERLTANGVFTEMYGAWGGYQVLDYAQLTQVYAFVDRNQVLKGDASRPLTREEVASVCRAAAGPAGENYVWSGTAYFKADENLRAVVITGDKMDGTATVTVTIAQEEGVAFTRNLVEEDGKRTYFGTENQSKFNGFELVRCFWEAGWDHVYAQDAADSPDLYCYVQSKPAGGALCVEVRGHVGSGTLQENQDFTTQWFYQIDKDGLWFQTGNVNGKDIWKLPVLSSFDRDYDTLEELRGAVDEKYLPYLPTAASLPDYDEFTGHWVRNGSKTGQINEWLNVRWHKPWVKQGSYNRFSYGGDVLVTWPAQGDVPAVTDVSDRADYDFRLYPDFEFTNDGRAAEGLEAKLEWPTFRAADASLDLVRSRIYQEDENSTDCRFFLLHDDGALVQYLFQGMTAAEIWAVVEPTLPASGRSAELAGTYTMTVAADSELDEMDALFLPAVILREDGSCQCVQDPASSHLCEGRYSCRDGRVTVSCGQHHYEFEAVDDWGLRFVAGDSDAWTRYIGPEVTDGATFVNWVEYPVGAGAGHDTYSGTHHPEPTHHPEETHHVEETHHADKHH